MSSPTQFTQLTQPIVSVLSMPKREPFKAPPDSTDSQASPGSFPHDLPGDRRKRKRDPREDDADLLGHWFSYGPAMDLGQVQQFLPGSTSGKIGNHIDAAELDDYLGPPTVTPKKIGRPPKQFSLQDLQTESLRLFLADPHVSDRKIGLASMGLRSNRDALEHAIRALRGQCAYGLSRTQRDRLIEIASQCESHQAFSAKANASRFGVFVNKPGFYGCLKRTIERCGEAHCKEAVANGTFVRHIAADETETDTLAVWFAFTQPPQKTTLTPLAPQTQTQADFLNFLRERRRSA